MWELSRQAISGPEGDDSEVMGNRSLRPRDCSRNMRGKIGTGPKRAGVWAKPVADEGNMAMLQAKAQARLLRLR